MRHGKTYASLEAGDDVYNIGLNRAVTLIAEKVLKGPSRRFGATPARRSEDYPDRGGKIMLKKGRYGAYVTIDGINATIPDNIEPEKLTLAEAIALIEEARDQGRRQAEAWRRQKATKKAAKPAAAEANGAAESEKTTKKPAAKKKAAVKKAAPKKTAPEPVSLTEVAKAKATKVAAAKITKVAEKKSAGKARG